MKILLGAQRVKGIGGVQTWISTVALELRRRGHTVVVWGVDAPWALELDFDLAVLAHGGSTRHLFGKAKHTMLVSHGIIEPERPSFGADSYAFVSEEVRKHWSREMVPSVGPIIRQPIDCDFWSPGDPSKEFIPPDQTPFVYRHSYYSGLAFLPDICASLGLGFVHGVNCSPLLARDFMRAALCVVSSGRGALEAMACDTPTIIADYRPYNGEQLIDVGRGAETNYSGRGGMKATADSLAYEMEMRLSEPIAWRSGVEEIHAAPVIVDQILSAAGVNDGQEEGFAVAPI